MHPNDGRVVSNFIVQGLQGRDITIYGEGQQTRSFCYVLVFQPLPADDPMQRQPNIERAREKLQGWEPSVPLEQGLRRTIEYFDRLLSAQPAA